jgi:hypothetical protein
LDSESPQPVIETSRKRLEENKHLEGIKLALGCNKQYLNHEKTLQKNIQPDARHAATGAQLKPDTPDTATETRRRLYIFAIVSRCVRKMSPPFECFDPTCSIWLFALLVQEQNAVHMGYVERVNIRLKA